MTREKIIEAMARAMCTADFYDPDALDLDGLENWKGCINAARAALAAIEAAGVRLEDGSPPESSREKWNKVFPNGHPNHRPVMMGKHSVGHWTVWQKAIARAERLDPWLSDFITWTLWWDILSEERHEFLMQDLREQLAASPYAPEQKP